MTHDTYLLQGDPANEPDESINELSDMEEDAAIWKGEQD